MRGQPLSRATGSSGRWAYTLYDGAGAEPFIHALDTTGRTARCIDLAALAGTNLTHLRLRFAGRTLMIEGADGPVVNVDRISFKVSVPAVDPAAEAGTASRDR
jgi:hypothetical protein